MAAGISAVSCDAVGPLPGGTLGPAPTVVIGDMTCFYATDDPLAPAATMEWIVETSDAGELIHARLTLNPSFVDNTYGANAIGWPAKGGPKPPAPTGITAPTPPKPAAPMDMKAPAPPKDARAAHTFKDLVGSDHAEFKLSDANGKLILHFKADYLSESSSAASGYASLGIAGGDGKLLAGEAADVVAVSTSLERNLNACGLASYTTDSPATDLDYTPNPAAPSWDFRVVYDVWLRKSAFGTAGFGSAIVDFVHASPSKAGENTIEVEPRDCPRDWPYCRNPAGCEQVPECTENCALGI